MLAHAQALIGLGFPCAEIVRIAGHDGGSRNLEAALTHAQAVRGRSQASTIGFFGGGANAGGGADDDEPPANKKTKVMPLRV